MMQFKIGDGSTAIHWRQMTDGKLYLDFRLTPRKHAIGKDSNETSEPDLSIEICNHQSAGVLIWAISEILQRLPITPTDQEAK